MPVHAIDWIEANEDARRSALREAGLDGDAGAMPDLVAADPTRLLTAAKALVVEAVRRDAPAGVVEQLIGPVRRMAAGASTLGEHRYVLDVLASMRGLRDAGELEPVLAEAIAKAPDDGSRRKLEHALERVRQPLDREQVRFALDKAMTTEPNPGGSCLECCALACIFCLEVCLLCCAGGCALCA